MIAVRDACEIQVGESLENVRRILNQLAEDVDASVKCIEVLLKFPSKQLKLAFLEQLLQKDLSHQIAQTVYNQEFCSQLTSIHENMETVEGGHLEETQKEELEYFLEQITNLLTIRTYFRVGQLVDHSSDANEMLREFRFQISAPKLLMPHHDTRFSDMVGICHEMDRYLKQDPSVHRMFLTSLAGGCI